MRYAVAMVHYIANFVLAWAIYLHRYLASLAEQLSSSGSGYL